MFALDIVGLCVKSYLHLVDGGPHINDADADAVDFKYAGVKLLALLNGFAESTRLKADFVFSS
jgi:hypothetical protein